MAIATSLSAIGLWASMVVAQVAGGGAGEGVPPGSGRGAAARNAAVAPSIPPVSAAEFEKLMKELVPRGSEPWETINWRSDLLAARDEAIRSSRPLFLWAMNGHPLGCT